MESMKPSLLERIAKWKLPLIVAGSIGLGVGVTLFAVRSHQKSEGSSITSASEKKKDVYTCPMHPSILSDHPGTCPICHMDLQKVDDDGSAEDEKEKATGKHKKDVYTCPMHPAIVSDDPGPCPICHMDLQKVDEEEGSEAEQSAVSASKERKLLFYRHPMRPDITSKTPAKDEMGMDYVPVYEDETKDGTASGVEGRASFSLSAQKQQLIGVTTAKAEIRPLSMDIRASGKVAFDPDLFTALEEYRQAVIARSQMSESPYVQLQKQSDELIRSARTKLRLMGLTDAQIKSSMKESSMNLILPTGTVWIYAEIFEYEMSGVKSGQKVEVEAPSVPGKVFLGKLTSVSPILNSQSRTVRVRAQVPDPEALLKPDNFVNVRIKIELGDKLVVPADSVLHSGQQNFVFVVKEKGRFEPRAVSVGTKAQDLYEVLSGLEPGETVATAANFLIDSESRLKSVLQNSQSQSKSAAQGESAPAKKGKSTP